MRRSGLPLRLIVPAALVVLVAVLATLQYHWLGQVSEAERERLQKSLRGQAQDFADAFDAELLWIQMALQSAGPVAAADGERFAQAFATWKEKARYPRILRDVFLVQEEGGRDVLSRFDPDTRSFVGATWSPDLAPLRSRVVALRHLVPEAPDPKRILPPDLTLLHDPIVASIPAVLVSVPTVKSTEVAGTRSVVSVRLGGRFLAARLDRNYIRSSLLPALAAEHFGGRDADAYRIAVLDSSPPAAASGRVLFSRGLAEGTRIDPGRADLVVPLFALRFDLAPRVAPRLGTSPDGAAAHTNLVFNRQITLPAAEGSVRKGTVAIFMDSRSARGDALKFNARTAAGPVWQLVLQHPAGSLDAAVASARRRNLWLSFGILAVLAASVVLVVVNAHRSERLAGQQMDFVATVSHELRTPLAVIRSAAQNLSAGVVNDAERTRYYGEMIDTEGRRLTDMVEQVLEFANLSGNRAPAQHGTLDIPSLVRDVTASWAPMLAGQDVELAADVADDVPPVQGDAAALRRAVNNLIGNAVKYGADGRWIGVAARRSRGRGGREEVLITVSDRGPGITAADLAHVFEPFYRGRDAVERQVTGNGLGLSLVKRIAEAHGGRTSVRSAPGQGASFTIHLPVRQPASSE